MIEISFLYIKTHNKTGLKYLGQTKKNPFTYKGSGNRWLNHLRKHGNDITTEVIAAFENQDDLREAGLFWSRHWNIVESDKWANLHYESGTGAPIGNTYRLGKKFSSETKTKLSHKKIGNKNRYRKSHSDETKQKLRSYYTSDIRKNHSTKTKLGMTPEVRKKIRIAATNRKKSRDNSGRFI